MNGAARSLPTPEAFEQQLTHFINATLLGGGDAVRPDTRLFEEGYINSLRILDLIAVVEKTLDRRIPDRAVRLANFRTVATIVRAFHPDAAAPSAPAAPSDRLFEHRTTRDRLASPIDALVQRGDLTITGAGQVTLSGLALDILRAVDDTVVQWAAALGAAERSYPSLIDHDILVRAGQVDSFPQHLTRVCHPDEERSREEGATRTSSPLDQSRERDGRSLVANAPPHDRHGRHALAPAVCYHSYPEWQGRAIGPEPALLTACGRCYRYEGGAHVALERLWEFSMREIVVLGTQEQVERVRQGLVKQVSVLVTTLGLDGVIEIAADPFFTSGDEGRRLMQQAGALKYELQLTIERDGRRLAVASFNHHHEFFGRRFDITLAAGGPAHTGCVAFGLERWVLAVLAQHGVDARDWPEDASRWLETSRARRARTAARPGGVGV